MSMTLNDAKAKVVCVEESDLKKAYARLDSLTKPIGSLGLLEEMAARYAAFRGVDKPAVGGKKVFVFAGDHGVVEEGVSAYPPEVTSLMLANFLMGGAAINVLSRRAGAEVEVIDIGVGVEPEANGDLVSANVKRGTDNMAKGPAMSVDEAIKAIEVGIERAELAAEAGVTIVATGEMGIGNTTPAAAIMSAILELPVEDVVGPGTGLDGDGVSHKAEVIKKALEVNASRMTGPLEILAAVGGMEIAGICGLCLGAAATKMAVLVDGYISTAGALIAMKLCPAVKDYLFFSHMSAEPGHRKFFETEELRPVLDLGLRLGEGTGAAIAMQILEDAVAIYNDMATFEDMCITPGA
jgi:nicotinate-nucleotide--dimethylbenzimidazole phosphoribosyltransferase